MANGNFTNIKENIKRKFDISSNELSKAIKIIEKNYEMANLISAPVPLKGVTLNDLIFFFDEWIKFHDIEKLKNPNPVIESICFGKKDDLERVCAGIIKMTECESTCWLSLAKHLNPISISDLKALFYFGRDRMDYSEYYVSFYARYLLKAFTRRFSTSI